MAAPLQYPRCEGQRWLIRRFEDSTKKHGYAQDAIRCPGCADCQPEKKPVGRVRSFLAKIGVRA